MVRAASGVISAAAAALLAGCNAAPTPVVQMHGMGDFAHNPAGMVPLAKAVSKALGGAYVTNVQIGRGPVDDMANGFLMQMNDQVDEFASVVSADPELSEGFDAIGYSQGNIIIRAYIQRYNQPPVRRFLSMHGPMMGVAGLPGCNVSRVVCDEVDKLAAMGAYTDFVQQHLAQANYFRDPLDLSSYLDHNIFLPDINNELTANGTQRGNPLYGERLSSLEALVLVKALGDTTVTPNDSEWFGYFKDGSMKEVWSLREAPWYGSFGLDRLDAEGRIAFEATEGDHLKFSEEELLGLVTKYFTD